EGEESFREHRSLLQGLKNVYKDGRLDYRIHALADVEIAKDPVTIQRRSNEIKTQIEAILDRCNKDEAKREIWEYLFPVLVEDSQRHHALQLLGEILDAESEIKAEREAKMLPTRLLAA